MIQDPTTLEPGEAIAPFEAETRMRSGEVCYLKEVGGRQIKTYYHRDPFRGYRVYNSRASHWTYANMRFASDEAWFSTRHKRVRMTAAECEAWLREDLTRIAYDDDGEQFCWTAFGGVLCGSGEITGLDADDIYYQSPLPASTPPSELDQLRKELEETKAKLSANEDAKMALAFIRRLDTGLEIVSSSECTSTEIAFAGGDNRMLVTSNHLGYVLRRRSNLAAELAETKAELARVQCEAEEMTAEEAMEWWRN